MSRRPAIPAEIVREILVESGHRCAVCGVPCPLERAHIIPWHKSKEHKVEDLICLCANCHQRADLEKWGEMTMRKYKQRPWVVRNYEKRDIYSLPKTKVELKIKMEIENFDEKNQRWIQNAIAGFLEISPESVQIVSIEKGSVKVIIELPTHYAEILFKAYKRKDPELLKILEPLVLINVNYVQKDLYSTRADKHEKEENIKQGSKLYVGNLSYSVSNEDLKELFSDYGEVRQVEIIESKGYGFVEMSNHTESERAKEALNGSYFEGRNLIVVRSSLTEKVENKLEEFDVFIIYSHSDVIVVKELAIKLVENANLRVWYDKWQLIPGENLRPQIYRGLYRAKTCVICLGAQTPSGLFKEEIERAFIRQTEDKSFRVIPILLPGAKEIDFYNFVELTTCINFKNGINDEKTFHILVSGIRGLPPGRFIEG
jgi:RNA recognition motif-containing protein